MGNLVVGIFQLHSKVSLARSRKVVTNGVHYRLCQTDTNMHNMMRPTQIILQFKRCHIVFFLKNSLAVKGAFADRLQRCKAYTIENDQHGSQMADRVWKGMQP